MKRLLLLGGGHAHVHVLAELARQPIPGWKPCLVTPHRRQIYSGMLPGWVAGHYPLDACAIALDRLADTARIDFRQTEGVALDLERGEVKCADGSVQRFDLLSIDTGPVPALGDLPGARAHALPIRPIEGFIAAWPPLVDHMRSTCRRFDLAILGAGAAGVELAFAIQHRAAHEGWSHLRLAVVGAESLPLSGMPQPTRRHAARLLAPRGIRWIGARRAVHIDAGSITFQFGDPLAFDACIVSTGAAAPRWPQAAGLATDAQGFVRVERTLQSVSHGQVFAAGDVAAYADPRPKSGVFAVRAGPVLADNLRAACEGRALEPWTPQARALYLVSTGDKHALATWGRWSWSGRWVWRWKDRIDRAFMRRFGTVA
jgi:selenide,water dikinase